MEMKQLLATERQELGLVKEALEDRGKKYAELRSSSCSKSKAKQNRENWMQQELMYRKEIDTLLRRIANCR